MAGSRSESSSTSGSTIYGMWARHEEGREEAGIETGKEGKQSQEARTLITILFFFPAESSSSFPSTTSPASTTLSSESTLWLFR